MTIDRSPAQTLISELAELGEDAFDVLDATLAQLSITELAALWHDWDLFWARPKQLIPETNWRSWGYLTGRGFGKSRAISEFVQREVMARRARRIALIAQTETKTIEVMVDGPSGLIATSPPWFRARFEKGRVIWPNGAQAFVYTPEVPGGLRGPEHDLAWMSEVIAWPEATREEAISNLMHGVRTGRGRMVWDTTPKRRHPTLRRFLKRSEKHKSHVVVRGSMRENADNLTDGLISELEEEFGGTQQGREELDGEFIDTADGAAWREDWIERSRRVMPAGLKRRILSVDPAITSKRGSDETGITDLGLGHDDQLYLIANLTGKHQWEAWGELVVVRYFEALCDCVVLERNRGGDSVVANLRIAAKDPKIRERVFGRQKPGVDLPEISVVIVEKGAQTRHERGTLYVKEETASQSKADRHQPIATLYEKGRVSHVKGADLESIEDTMTTWEPVAGRKSPDAIDSLVQGIWELACITNVDPREAFNGLSEMAAKIKEESPGGGFSRLLGGHSRGDRF